MPLMQLTHFDTATLLEWEENNIMVRAQALESGCPLGLEQDASLSLREICTPVTLGSLNIPHSACRRTLLGGHSSQGPVGSRGRTNIKFICLW